VRRLRKIMTVFALVLLLVLGLLAGALGVSVYANLGSNKSITANGPVIDAKELDACAVVLIDFERLVVSRPSLLSILPNPLEEIRITVFPETIFTAGLLPRENTDSAILGFDTCIATLEENSWTVIHSALGQPWFPVADNNALIASGTGTSISFDVAQVSSSTLIIANTNQDIQIQQIRLDAELSFPNANVWAVGLAIAAGVLVVLFIALTVAYIVHTRRRPRA
jgi:hypothetical protein